MDLQKIIDEANKQLAAKAALAKAEEEALEQKQKPRKEQKSKKDKDKKEKKSDKIEADKSKRKNKDPEILEKQLTKLFAKFVPNFIARYKEHFDKEDLKKRAKEIVGILVQKEMRPGHQIKSLKELSEEKKKKIKIFSRTYMDKLVTRQKERVNYKTKSISETLAIDEIPLYDQEQTGVDADIADSDSTRRRRRSTSTNHEMPESKRVRSYSPEPEKSVELSTVAFEPELENKDTNCEIGLDGGRIVEDWTTTT